MKKTIKIIWKLLLIGAQLVGMTCTYIFTDAYMIKEGFTPESCVMSLVLVCAIMLQFCILGHEISLFTKKQRYISKKEILLYARKHRQLGLCLTLERAVEHFGLTGRVKELFPLFTRQNALLFGANENNGWWWERHVWDTGRDDFLSWLIEQYKDEYIRV